MASVIFPILSGGMPRPWSATVRRYPPEARASPVRETPFPASEALRALSSRFWTRVCKRDASPGMAPSAVETVSLRPWASMAGRALSAARAQRRGMFTVLTSASLWPTTRRLMRLRDSFSSRLPSEKM